MATCGLARALRRTEEDMQATCRSMSSRNSPAGCSRVSWRTCRTVAEHGKARGHGLGGQAMASDLPAIADEGQPIPERVAYHEPRQAAGQRGPGRGLTSSPAGHPVQASPSQRKIRS
jgi:hypothetical protein